jgi:AraC-like DNA-binding protein
MPRGNACSRANWVPQMAFEVGYESPSQFNREYRRFFGQPPIHDINALRDGKVVAIATA